VQVTVEQLLAKIGQLTILLDAANARIAELESGPAGQDESR